MGRYVDARSKTQQVRRGVEIQVGRGLPIHASGGGQVVYIGETPGLGLVVAVEHDENLMTFVGRLAELRVGLGDGVDEDTVLGRSAETTVYFEVRIRGLAVDPLRWVANYASAAKPVAP
jgi:murein DD-endopeptidase MepM/ murein hydrolase activator NlpD